MNNRMPMAWMCGWLLAVFLPFAARPSAGSDLRLVDAAKNKDRATVEALLKQHVDANTPQGDGATALAWAAHWDDLDMADQLIHAGAKVNAANDYGVTPLALACLNGSAPMVEKLLKAGADANATQASGETALMTCARTGNLDAVNLLLGHEAHANASETEGGQTALMWAVAEKHPEVVKALIARGADVRAHSRGGFTPLLFAAQQGDVDSARLLLAAGADGNEPARGGMTPLLIAASSGQGPCSVFLLDQGADPNAADARGYTALHFASQNRALLELVKALLAHHANPNARLSKGDTAGATPFYLAASGGNVAAMRALANGGADATLATKQNTTPLMVAAGVGRFESRTDAQNRNALEAVKLAVELGNDVNAVGENGWTALHGAAYTGSDAIVQFLVSKGAKLDVFDQFGQTPLSIAQAVVTAGLGGNADVRPRRYRKSTVELLLKLGATPTERAGVHVVGSMAVKPD
jgi:uncharacterized protein